MRIRTLLSVSKAFFALSLILLLNSSAWAVSKAIVCQNTAGVATLPNCGGIAGCTITVALGTVGDPAYSSTKYHVTRTRAAGGGFIFKTKSTAARRCTLQLSNNQGSIKKCSCGKTLVTAACAIHVVG